MKHVFKILVFSAVCLSFAGCKVNKTQEGKLPAVKVDASAGKLPEYNVQGPKVDVGSKNETVKVPTVHVKTP